MEILVQRKDLEDLRDFILHAEYDTEEFQNEGHVTFTYDPDALGYVIYLYSRQNLLRILSGKRYRCYKYCVGKRKREWSNRSRGFCNCRLKIMRKCNRLLE